MGKKLFFVTPDVDLSTPEGEHVVISLMAVAQLQAQQLGDKMHDVVTSIRGKGQHSGGPVPFGYSLLKFPDTPGYGYAIYPLDAWIVQQMAKRYLNGNSMRGIATWLNTCGIPSPNGADKWGTETVKHILISPAIAGIMTMTGTRVDRKYKRNEKAAQEPLYNSMGEMVRMVTAPGIPVEGIISIDDWQKIKNTMKLNGHSGPRGKGSHLKHIVICECGCPMYSCPQTVRGTTYRYMKCARKIKVEIPGNCANPVIRAELIESALHEAIMWEIGDAPVMEQVTGNASDKRKALDFIETQLAELAEVMISGAMSPMLAAKAEQGLNAKRQQLMAEIEASKPRWQPKGITYGQEWESMTWPERQRFLIDHGVKAIVSKPSKDASRVKVDLGQLSPDQSDYIDDRDPGTDPRCDVHA